MMAAVLHRMIIEAGAESENPLMQLFTVCNSATRNATPGSCTLRVVHLQSGRSSSSFATLEPVLTYQESTRSYREFGICVPLMQLSTLGACQSFNQCIAGQPLRDRVVQFTFNKATVLHRMQHATEISTYQPVALQ
jgi:hypothetical protein